MQSLPRVSLVPVGLFAAGVLAVLGYTYITRDHAVTAAPLARASGQRAVPSVPADADASMAQASEALEAPRALEQAGANAVAPEAVSTLIAQATGTDAAKRAAAITALATAPREQAIPVLEQVLQTADETDLPRALHSLHALAQGQGDADDRIRGVVRKIVFHSGDEAAVQAAQATLEEIEHDLSQSASVGKRSRG